MKKSDDKLAYFKQNPAYKRIFEAMLKQWKSYGRCAGTIHILNATEAEKEALGSVIGKTYYENDISFKFKEFEDALQNTIFSGTQMLKLLESYFGYCITTNKEVDRIKNEKRTQFFLQLQEELTNHLNDANSALTYVAHIQEKKDSVYSLIMREYKKDQKQAITIVVNAWKAVEHISNCQRIRLAVLATNVCGLPHYFDRDTTQGKCLLYVLSYVQQIDFPKGAEEIANLYYAFHILPDDISNFTTAYGIHLYGEFGIHKAYEAFIEQKEPYLVSLSNLNNIVRADSTNKVVYIVENQMLFSQICEEIKDADVSILCTSGQLKIASLLLVDMLCQSNCELYYAGDFDPEGILIADRVIARNPSCIHPWFYRIQDYEKAISKESISDERLKQLQHVSNEELQNIVDCMLHKKRAGYQEALLDSMVRFIQSH